MKIAIVGPIATENILKTIKSTRNNLPPGYKGAPLLSTLITELLNRGHQVSAFTSSPKVVLGEKQWQIAEGDNFRIYYCGVRPHSFRPKHGYPGRAVDFFGLERCCLKNAILYENPDVVHAHWTYEFGLAALETGLPHVITAHDAPQVVLKYMPNLYRLFRFFMAKECLKKAKIITAVSGYLKKKIENYCTVPVSVIPNPLPTHMTEQQKNMPANKKNNSNNIIAMVLNGWGKRKNAKAALIAFNKLYQRVPNTEMHIFGGDFGEGEVAHRWARDHQVDEGVSFRGRLPHDILLDSLKEATIYLHPSLEETFGVSVAEAMQLGIPVIGGKDSGAVPWVIGESGILVDVRSDKEIEKALYKLLSNKKLRNHYSNSAIKRTQIFSVSSVVNNYEVQYQNALNKIEYNAESHDRIY